ncbi:MAG TPA: hypothetical protein VH682_30020 [Gemmataceae bacterium]|jgi:hypothetical protein
MLDYRVDTGELASACEPYDSSYVPQNIDGIQLDECFNWGNYALFVIEQQGSCCQLV